MLELQNIHIAIAQQNLFNNFSCRIQNGQILTIMGPSGSGKSTLLDYISGHLHSQFIASGNIVLDEKVLNNVDSYKRRIGILFQDDVLFPHFSILENLLFAIPQAVAKNKKQHIALALQTLHEIQLFDYANAYPNELSGGQKARIALMRMLLSQPQCVLLDEPFSKLDQQLKSQIRQFVFSHIKQSNIPCLLVTHDTADAPEQIVQMA